MSLYDGQQGGYKLEDIRNHTISLPVNEGSIDFDFMELLISSLKFERLNILEAHLLGAEMTDFNLTESEQKVLDDYDSLQWKEFRMGDLYERIKTKKLPFKADDLPKQKTGNYVLPCLTSSFNNQGLNYYAPKDDATILRNVISIPSNSDVYRAYFQPNEFTVLSDAYTLRWVYGEVELTPKQYLFTIQCINKVTDLPIYSYKNKLGGWNVVKEKYIQLPIKNGEPDYGTMETFISALQKKMIKNIVIYTENEVKTNKLAVNG